MALAALVGHAVLAGLAALAGLEGHAAGAASAEPMDAARAAALPEASVYVLGETHDNPAHHQGQAAVVATLRPGAVVFEMLTPERAARWDPGLAGEPGALDAALGWSEAGWPDLALYAPLFEAIPEDAAVIGADPGPRAAREAMKRGAASAFGADAARFGLDEPLPPEEQAAREAAQLASHCDALPADLLPGFVEAQRLRDAAFARAVLEALETHGRPVVLITGNGHARTDWGVPAALARAAPDLPVLSIGQFEGEGGPPVDVVVTTDGPPDGRPDPCEGFEAPRGD